MAAVDATHEIFVLFLILTPNRLQRSLVLFNFCRTALLCWLEPLCQRLSRIILLFFSNSFSLLCCLFGLSLSLFRLLFSLFCCFLGKLLGLFCLSLGLFSQSLSLSFSFFCLSFTLLRLLFLFFRLPLSLLLLFFRNPFSLL